MIREKDVRNHLSRTEGQIRGIIKMLDNGSECQDVLTQLKAVRSNIEKVISLVAVNNLVECMGASESNKELVDEAINMLIKSR